MIRLDFSRKIFYNNLRNKETKKLEYKEKIFHRIKGGMNNVYSIKRKRKQENE